MPVGPGKYDDMATLVREKIKAKGGVIVMVFDGERGNGFSVQTTLEILTQLPMCLRGMAGEIEAGLLEGRP